MRWFQQILHAVFSLKRPAHAGSHAQGSFSLSPHDKTLYCWPTSLAASLPLSLHSTSFCLPSAFCWLFNSRKETLLEGEFAIYFRRQKKKEKGLWHFVSPPHFCLHSLRIFALRAIVESLHPARASVPSVCPRGVRTGRARLAKCTGGWVTVDSKS